MPRKNRKTKRGRRQRIDPEEEPSTVPAPPKTMGFNSEEFAYAGQFVYRGMPLAFALHDDILPLHCNYCMSRYIHRQCPGCGVMKYCNETCQELDRYHMDTECHLIKQHSPDIPPSLMRYFGELVIRYKRDPFKLNGEALSMRAITFAELDYCRHQVQNANDLEEMSDTYDYLCGYINPEDMISYEDFTEVYCKGKQYVTKVYLPYTYSSKAIALYLGLCLFKHSCSPNSVQSWDAREMYIYTTEDLPIKAEHMVTVNRLGYQAKGRIQRKARMAKECMSICTCRKCSIEEEDRPFSELYNDPNDRVVKKVQLSWKIVKQLNLDQEENLLQAIQIASTAWYDMEGVFGPLHVFRAKYARFLTYIYFRNRELREARKYSLRLLDFCEAYYGDNHLRTALVKLFCSYLDGSVGKEEASKRHFDGAFERYRNSLGESNVFFFNLWRDFFRLCRFGGWTIQNINLLSRTNSIFRGEYLEIY